MLKLYVRKIEDLFKNIFYFQIVLINHLFIFFYNKKRKKLFFKDFFNHDAYIYFVLSLSKKIFFYIKLKTLYQLQRNLVLKIL